MYQWVHWIYWQLSKSPNSSIWRIWFMFWGKEGEYCGCWQGRHTHKTSAIMSKTSMFHLKNLYTSCFCTTSATLFPTCNKKDFLRHGVEKSTKLESKSNCQCGSEIIIFYKELYFTPRVCTIVALFGCTKQTFCYYWESQTTPKPKGGS